MKKDRLQVLWVDIELFWFEKRMFENRNAVDLNVFDFNGEHTCIFYDQLDFFAWTLHNVESSGQESVTIHLKQSCLSANKIVLLVGIVVRIFVLLAENFDLLVGILILLAKNFDLFGGIVKRTNGHNQRTHCKKWNDIRPFTRSPDITTKFNVVF